MATGNYYEEHRGSAPIYRPQSGRCQAPAVYPTEMVPETKTGAAYAGKKKRSRGLSILVWSLRAALILFLICIAAGSILLFSIIRSAPSLDAMSVAPSQSATYICDSSGNREQKLTLPEANRDLVTIDKVPEDLQHAFVAIEDSRFYSHHGIDPVGIARAVVIGLTSGNFSEGASTITQQLLKNSIFTDWTSERTFLERLRRKIQEQYLALRLEKMMTKDQILEDYMNIINLGAGCYGVQAAAYRYFGKDVSDLTLSECAVIAGITQNPTRYNPIVNPDANAQRRETVLSYMADQGYISRAQMEEALADDVYERIQFNEESIDVSSSIYSFYEDALINQVMNDLMNEKDYTYKQAYKAVYTGGLRIYSAQDPAVQKVCDEAFADPANFPAGTGVGIDYALSIESTDGEITHYGNDELRSWVRSTGDSSFNLLCTDEAQARALAEGFKTATFKDGDTLLGERITITPQPQASAVIIDQATGQVKAVVGGRGDKDASLTLNRATYTTRQPGSTFKILTAFAPALSEGSASLNTVYPGEFNYEDGTPVSNWDLNRQSSDTTMREAIIRSVNTAAVACITQVTPQLGYDYARAFGITTLTDHYETNGAVLSDVVQPLALGGITKGVTTLELAGAYACIANAGKYIQPRFYTQVLDSDGNVVLDHTQPAERTVLREAVAYELTSAMEDVIRDPEGTAYDEINLGNMGTAGKTGTTSDYRDIWFAGYTPYYTCCVWGGYDNNSVLPDDETGGKEGLGHTYSKVLWNAIMSGIHETLPVKTFAKPAGVQTLSVCAKTHMAAAPSCPKAYDEVFEAGTAAVPDHYCNVHSDGRAVDPMTAETDASLAGEPITITTTDQAVIPAPSDPTWPDQGGISISNQANDDSIFNQSQEQLDAITIFTSDTAGSASSGADSASGAQTAPTDSSLAGWDAGTAGDAAPAWDNTQTAPAQGSTQTAPAPDNTQTAPASGEGSQDIIIIN